MIYFVWYQDKTTIAIHENSYERSNQVSYIRNGTG